MSVFIKSYSSINTQSCKLYLKTQLFALASIVRREGDFLSISTANKIIISVVLTAMFIVQKSAGAEGGRSTHSALLATMKVNSFLPRGLCFSRNTSICGTETHSNFLKNNILV